MSCLWQDVHSSRHVGFRDLTTLKNAVQIWLGKTSYPLSFPLNRSPQWLKWKWMRRHHKEQILTWHHLKQFIKYINRTSVLLLLSIGHQSPYISPYSQGNPLIVKAIDWLSERSPTNPSHFCNFAMISGSKPRDLQLLSCQQKGEETNTSTTTAYLLLSKMFAIDSVDNPVKELFLTCNHRHLWDGGLAKFTRGVCWCCCCIWSNKHGYIVFF